MARLYPFRALMPKPAQAADVAAVPYDVVSRAEAIELADNKPLSFLHVSRPDIDLPAGADAQADGLYETAKDNFARLRQAALVQDDEAAFYIYSLVDGGHRQTGVVAAAAVDDYDEDLLKKHERTRPDKEDDRTLHALALRAHTGPVFVVQRSDDNIDAIVADQMTSSPLLEVTAPDGVRHQVWRAPATSCEQLQALFAAVPTLYIADGHHRAKAASRVREDLRRQNPEHTGNEAYNRFLSVVFPADQVRILAYNRVVTSLHGLTVTDFLDRVADSFEIAVGERTVPAGAGEFCMYLDGQWYQLLAGPAPARATPSEALDVSVLQDQLLRPILGIDDPRTHPAIDFVGGIRGTNELERRVNAHEGDAVAFSLHPVSIEQLLAIADAGEIMPPKSTWFEPKLRDGLLSYLF